MLKNKILFTLAACLSLIQAQAQGMSLSALQAKLAPNKPACVIGLMVASYSLGYYTHSKQAKEQKKPADANSQTTSKISYTALAWFFSWLTESDENINKAL